MNKLLIVVDMQNDFIDGSLGSSEAQAIIPAVVKKINSWDGDIVATQDTHYDNYLETQEGKNLPILHCQFRSYGHIINTEILNAFSKKNNVQYLEKTTFASQKLIDIVAKNDYDEVQLIGLCTDICVVSNALLLKAFFPELSIKVDSSCCAGVTTKRHAAALETMKSCQIDIL